MLKAIIIHHDYDIKKSKLLKLVDKVVKNNDARSFHVMQRDSFLQYICDQLPNKLVKLNEIDYAMVKIGLGLTKKSILNVNHYSGKNECVIFINSVVSKTLDKLKNELRGYNRLKAILKIYLNIERSNAEDDAWRQASSAVLGLHGDGPEGLGLYIKNSSEYYAVNVTSRILTEICICESPLDGGENISNMELRVRTY